MRELTRRDFLKAGTAGAVGLGMMMLGGSATANAAEAGTYNPGTYKATATGIGNVTVTMTFDAENITDVIVDVSEETPAIGGTKGEQLAELIMSTQSAGFDLDSVSGATLTGSAARQAADACIKQAKGESILVGGNTGSSGAPSFLEIPDDVPEAAITATVDADVVVVGAGVAGMSAARAAAEGGKKVVVIEKGAHVMCRGNFGCQFGCIDSFVHKEHGIEVDKGALLDRYMRDTLQMADAWFLKYWMDNSAACLDWMLEAVDGYVMDSEDRAALPDGVVDLTVNDYSAQSGDDMRYPEFSTRVNIRCNNSNLNEGGFYPILYGFQSIIESKGGSFYFNTFAEQLIKENGAVTGVLCRGLDGFYTRFNAKQVVLATGDFGSSSEMKEYYAPQIKDVMCIYNCMDAEGKACNTGDGHKMAMWAGAHMEPGPYAPMAHLKNVNDVLIVNSRGERICNEDLGAQSITNVILRLPNQKAYVISGNSQGSVVLDPGPFGKATEETYGDNDFDKMAAYIGEDCDPEVLKNTVMQYNEFCKNKLDTQYYKNPKYLVELDAPYYATVSGPGALLVIMGGIACDHNGQALDDKDKPIEGLFVTGNVQGGRFGAEYPMTAPAISHGIAFTLGRMVGNHVASL